MKSFYQVRVFNVCCEPGCDYRAPSDDETRAHILESGHETAAHRCRIELFQCGEKNCTITCDSPEAVKQRHADLGGCCE